MRRKCLGVLATLILASAVELRLFVFPSDEPSADADLVVVLDGARGRLAAGERLVQERPGATLLLSSPRDASCPTSPGRWRTVCFHPEPSTTAGEAKGAIAIATEMNVTSVTVVAGVTQMSRARMLFSRCWDGELGVVGVKNPDQPWLGQLLYANAAMIKDLVSSRTC